MSVESLRNARTRAVVAFTEFTRAYKQYPSALYCFFEGEDSKYYGVRIESYARPSSKLYFNCGGKRGVLRVHQAISSEGYYESAKVAFFIDRDFDAPICESEFNHIYETPSYSIENFYTSHKCLAEILRSEFKLLDSSEDFNLCLNLFKNSQEKFHDAMSLLNAWLACQRARACEVCLSGVSAFDFVRFDFPSVVQNYTLDELHRKFPKAEHIPLEELASKEQELAAKNRQKSFRGKFEIEFSVKFIRKLLEEAGKNGSSLFSCKINAILKLSDGNIISELSQYADTPECLKCYLESFKAAP